MTWKLKDAYTSNWTLKDLARQLWTFGWQVPAYPLPEKMEDIMIMRVVVRHGFSMDLAHYFMKNLKQALDYLDSLDAPLPRDPKKDIGFHHEAKGPTHPSI